MITYYPLFCRGSVTTLVAVVHSDEDDRASGQPRPIDRSAHAESCRCDPCVQARQTTAPLLGETP